MKRMKKLLAFALVLLIGGGIFLSALPFRASAESVTYSDVLEDLQKDPKFDATKYPAKADDTSVSLIQIAESEDNELFLYVYQPSDATIDLKCKSVSIHIGYSVDGAGLDPVPYDLKLVSEQGVFDKYLVQGFILPKDAERYYNIVTLWREYNKTVDGDSGVVTTEKGYDVGQQWCAYTLNDRRVYEMNTFNTLDIDYTMVSSVLFKNGIMWGDLVGFNQKCDAHFIAFNCEQYIIDKIFEAKLSYTKTNITKTMSATTGQIQTNESKTVVDNHYLSSSDEMNFEGKGLYPKKFKWNRIQKASEFISVLTDYGMTLSDEDLKILQNSQWVFSFLETENFQTTQANITHWGYTEVSLITILRLYFQDNTGNVYDLGVVSDRSTSTGSIGELGGTDWDDGWEQITFWLSLIAVGIVLIFFFGPFVTICKVIFSCFVSFVQIVLWFILILFKVIKRIVFPKK